MPVWAISPTCPNLPQSAPICPNLPQSAPTCPNLPQPAPICPNLPQSAACCLLPLPGPSAGRWRTLSWLCRRCRLQLAMAEQLDLVGRTAEMAR